MQAKLILHCPWELFRDELDEMVDKINLSLPSKVYIGIDKYMDEDDEFDHDGVNNERRSKE